MTNSARREIVGGPNTEELFLACRLRHEGRETYFTVAPSHITGRVLANGRKFIPGNLKFKVQVTQIGGGDSTGVVWLFKAYDEHATLGTMYLEGCINTTARAGWIQPATN